MVGMTIYKFKVQFLRAILRSAQLFSAEISEASKIILSPDWPPLFGISNPVFECQRGMRRHVRPSRQARNKTGGPPFESLCSEGCYFFDVLTQINTQILSRILVLN